MIKTKKILTCLLITAALCTQIISLSANAADIRVKVDGITSNVMSFVDYSSVSPVSVNNVTMVPLRSTCEATGFSVDWNQSTQTATITLAALADSSRPVEQYAYQLLEQTHGYGLNLSPKSISAELKLDAHNLFVKYNFTDVEGDLVSMGKETYIDVPTTMVQDGTIMVPLRSLMELFGLEVDWEDAHDTIRISLPVNTVPMNDMRIVPSIQNAQPVVDAPAPENMTQVQLPQPTPQPVVFQPETTAPTVSAEGKTIGNYLGTFKITHYCACPQCSGIYGNSTAWAGPLQYGVTVAVDPDVIGKLTWIYIDGYGFRRAEDCGSAVKGNHIDVAVPSHEEALRLGVAYKDVWTAQ